MMPKVATIAAKPNATAATAISPTDAFSRSRSSANSTLASSMRVRSSETTDADSRAANFPTPPSRTDMKMRRSAPVHQQAGDEADCSGRADRPPGIVVHVVVGDARGVLGAVDRLALQFLKAQLGGEQFRLDLRAQVLRALAAFVAGALQKILGVGKHRGEIIEERFAGDGHARLLLMVARFAASSARAAQGAV